VNGGGDHDVSGVAREGDDGETLDGVRGGDVVHNTDLRFGVCCGASMLKEFKCSRKSGAPPYGLPLYGVTVDLTGLPVASKTTIGAMFVAFSGASIFDLSPTITIAR
jgi:hypothetical protein